MNWNVKLDSTLDLYNCLEAINTILYSTIPEEQENEHLKLLIDQY